MDIYETENELVLKADVPDLEDKDIDVRVEDNSLTIRGERKFEKDVRPVTAYPGQRVSLPGQGASGEGPRKIGCRLNQNIATIIS